MQQQLTGFFVSFPPQRKLTWVTLDLQTKTTEDLSLVAETPMRSMATGCRHPATTSRKPVWRPRPSEGWGRPPPRTQAEGTPSVITGMRSGEPQRPPPALRVSCWTESQDMERDEVCQRKVRRSHVQNINVRIVWLKKLWHNNVCHLWNVWKIKPKEKKYQLQDIH